MSKTDLTYLATNSLVVAFFPETPAGESAWDELARQTEGTGRVFAWQLASTLAQLRAAGYVVRKAKPSKPLTPSELDELLDDLA